MFKFDRVIIEVGKEENIYEIKKELSIDRTKINLELAEQPGKFAYWAAFLSAAEEQLSDKMLQLEISSAEKKMKKRKDWDFDLKKDGKYSNDALEWSLQTDEELVALKEEIIHLKKTKDIVKGVRDSFSHRKDCLVSIATNMRQGLDTDISVGKRKE